jgi:hypothetical protein
MRSTTLWIAVGVLGAWNLVLLAVMARWRTDRRDSGSSGDGASPAEITVFNPSNYSEHGRQMLPVLAASQLLLLGLVLYAVFK